jgi:hypothetical protein
VEQRRVIPFHPTFFAAYPVLFVYSQNSALIPVSDLLLMAGAFAAAGTILYLVIAALMRTLERPAALVSSLFLVLFTFPAFAYGMRQISLFEGFSDFFSFLFTTWIIVIALLVSALWAVANKPAVTKVMNLASVFLVIISSFSIWQTLRAVPERLIDTSALPAKSGSGKGLRPDVFFIILDGYGRADTLKHTFGFDNRPFLAEMEKRGFAIGEYSRPNYVQTELSLTSTLNLDYLQNLHIPSAPTPEWMRAKLDEMIDDSIVARCFRANGYSYMGVGSGFPKLRFSSADYRLINNNELPRLWPLLLDLTPLSATPPTFVAASEQKRDAILRAFRNVRELAPPKAKPMFLVMHVLAPHPAFVFNADGSDRETKHAAGLWDGSHFYAVGGTKADYSEGYIQQLQYINKLVLALVDDIIKVNPNAVIIVQGDHGSKRDLDQDSYEHTDMNEVVGLLNAVRAPELEQYGVHPTVTPVNTFRNLLSVLFGYDLPPLEDRSYYSTWGEPLKFYDVTPRD